ncbi:MAG: hypothetical protein M3O89_03955 [Actinomycetota bacterium]|nr:hypothetical protein [Actinomycetota bacterium]
MVQSGPRIDARLVAAIERLDDGAMPIAEVCRRIGSEAESAGLTRPSYEGIRELVHLSRAIRKHRRGPSALQLIWEGGGGMRGYSNTMDQLRLPREDRR